jgi:hypothetical protein
LRKLLSLLTLMTMPSGFAAAQAPAPTVATATIACRALEVHADARLGVTIVVFHQRDDRDRDRVGTLLRGHDGERIEFRTGEGAPHPATLMRLKSCFGRGLLLFPADAARIAEKDEFLLVAPASDPPQTSSGPSPAERGAQGRGCQPSARIFQVPSAGNPGQRVSHPSPPATMSATAERKAPLAGR